MYKEIYDITKFFNVIYKTFGMLNVSILRLSCGNTFPILKHQP